MEKKKFIVKIEARPAEEMEWSGESHAEVDEQVTDWLKQEIPKFTIEEQEEEQTRICAVHGKEHLNGATWEYDQWDRKSGTYKAVSCSATDAEAKNGESVY
jgi:hypothetical protein